MTAIDLVTAVRAGRLVDIPDSEGEVHTYLLRREEPGEDAWACRLTLLGGEEHQSYRVAVARSGAWRCSCRDSLYRSRKLRRHCKHAGACLPIYDLVREWVNVRDGDVSGIAGEGARPVPPEQQGQGVLGR